MFSKCCPNSSRKILKNCTNFHFFKNFKKKQNFDIFPKFARSHVFAAEKKNTQNFDIFLKFSNFGMNSAKFWKNIEFLFYFLNYGKCGKMDAKREENFFSLET